MYTRSIGVTLTRKPTIQTFTSSLSGTGKQKSVKRVRAYTDAVVTMISADGKNHTPSVVYTHNASFAPTQRNGKVGDRRRSELEAGLKKFGIDRSRINYQESKYHYRSESPAIYDDFLKRYPTDPATLIFHDGGNAFKRQKVSIFDDLKLHNHVKYPSDVRQYLSPNDNKLHGCKATWYREYYTLENDVSASLRLMQLIDLDAVKNSKKYFDDNILRVKKSQVAKIIRT